MPGERRPAPGAADAATVAARERTADLLARANARLDGLYALLGADDLRDAALLAGHANANLARYKQPRAFHHLATLPRNANGKLNRRALRLAIATPQT